jgi:hypothetical protein
MQQAQHHFPCLHLQLMGSHLELHNHTAQLLAVHLVLNLAQQRTCQGMSAVLQGQAEAQRDSIAARLLVGSQALRQSYCLEPLWCCQLLLRKGCCCLGLAWCLLGATMVDQKV